jgi:ribosome-associated heat shock protein Hsp15
MKQPHQTATIRVDKWLWAARFFKTRSLAMAAVNGGKVHVNGARIKPARKLDVGDQLTIRKGIYTFAITVTGLSLKRGPAEVARSLYCESQDSEQQRQQLRDQQKQSGTAAAGHQRRPDKRDRRQIHQFKIRQLKKFTADE